mmetsp:Transcript_3222/g.7580  ORF Transcript_3222/g.7580 Transcript_3222/m.7580 type:complete len:226 (+) Transcript_3222:1578-2255(+)
MQGGMRGFPQRHADFRFPERETDGDPFPQPGRRGARRGPHGIDPKAAHRDGAHRIPPRLQGLQTGKRKKETAQAHKGAPPSGRASERAAAHRHAGPTPTDREGKPVRVCDGRRAHPVVRSLPCAEQGGETHSGGPEVLGQEAPRPGMSPQRQRGRVHCPIRRGLPDRAEHSRRADQPLLATAEQHRGTAQRRADAERPRLPLRSQQESVGLRNEVRSLRPEPDAA